MHNRKYKHKKIYACYKTYMYVRECESILLVSLLDSCPLKAETAE